VVNALPLLVDVATAGTPPFDLSKATKLKELSFRWGGPGVQRVTTALQTVRSKNLQQIAIRLYARFVNPVEEKVRQEWQDLDRLLVQFWTSRSIRLKIKYEAWEGENSLGALAQSLLPELTRRGAVDLVEE
jgi:hypothetical protein